MTESIDERLKKLTRDFDKLLIKSRFLQKSSYITETTQSDLVRFWGLTPNEAEEWLKNEPNFVPSDEFLQRKKSDKDFTEPIKETLNRSIFVCHGKWLKMGDCVPRC